MRALLWLVLAAALLGIAVADSDDGNGQVTHLDESLGEGRRGKASTIRRGGGALQTTGQFTFDGNNFQGNFEEQTQQSLGEGDGGDTVPNSIPRPDEKLGESVRAAALVAGDTPKTLRAISSLVTKEVQQWIVARGQPTSASAAPSADTLWKGSFNLAHGKAQPATDGKLECTTLQHGKKRRWPACDEAVRSRCKTQIPVMVTPIHGGKPRLVRTHWQCTSCKPGNYLEIRTHKTMAGKCNGFGSPQAGLHCVPLGSNVYENDWTGGDKLCTKGGIVKQALTVGSLKDAAARKHFAPLAKGSQFGKVEAHCRAWKQVVCEGRTCRVKKDVKCVKVCRYYVPWGRHQDLCPLKVKVPGDPFAYDKECYAKWARCDGAYCKGRYGAMACTESAATF